jgi:hypothetical protein
MRIEATRSTLSKDQLVAAAGSVAGPQVSPEQPSQSEGRRQRGEGHVVAAAEADEGVEPG